MQKLSYLCLTYHCSSSSGLVSGGLDFNVALHPSLAAAGGFQLPLRYTAATATADHVAAQNGLQSIATATLLSTTAVHALACELQLQQNP